MDIDQEKQLNMFDIKTKKLTTGLSISIKVWVCYDVDLRYGTYLIRSKQVEILVDE